METENSVYTNQKFLRDFVTTLRPLRIKTFDKINFFILNQIQLNNIRQLTAELWTLAWQILVSGFLALDFSVQLIGLFLCFELSILLFQEVTVQFLL